MARILVADDSANLLAQLGLALRDAGHSVTSTNIGADAVCLLSHRPHPDLLILDLGLAGTDGRPVLESLGPAAPPAILITGGVVTAQDAARVARVLKKPFELHQLLEAVASVLMPNPATVAGVTDPAREAQATLPQPVSPPTPAQPEGQP